MSDSNTHGELLNFLVRPNGDVEITTSDVDDRYGHDALIPYATLQGMAEASRTARDTMNAAETAKREAVNYFYRKL